MTTRSDLTYPAHLRLATLKLAAGRTPGELGLNRWTITDHEEVLGHGEDCFREASHRLLTWQAHRRARVHAERFGPLVRLYMGPRMSSCYILLEEQTPTRTVLVYGTLPAHVELGEEAFIIDLAPDGTVTGRVIAFSRHAWWLAKIGAPAARAVQRWANRAYVSGMRPGNFP
ncbi:DUF1990 domain-containing protein [Corynebacterium hylobatis]|uniref:DUF1990 domain-containing protein n=1 Tax=Corynebacterium hylobatis TaxID=1859290 RepID=A0A3S0BHQ5_9CORY|nr:DUF1990 domain-containing protein [Corynebacterium hylobatis]RSZ63501.1 DUF1990 domain-containing protein [Corynebacterium hylobatis]